MNEPFRILAADLSLRRPGFAQIDYDPRFSKITSVSTCNIDNGDKLPHGALLMRIYDALGMFLPTSDVLVREKGFSRFPRETQALFKVVGVCDLAAWTSGKRVFEEFAPTTIKKLLTGNGKASKPEVAEALTQHVGHLEYLTDDESDAVAVGIAWLQQDNREA